MQIKCEYCGHSFPDTEGKCPNCGAPNSHVRRSASGVPKTIEELKRYCEENGYTAQRTRFFIGENYTRPKAFGIYKDEGGKFIVYKNKANGERAVRYEGYDEEYAVGQIYERLQDEILNQKSHYVEKKKRQAISDVTEAEEKHRVNRVIMHYAIFTVVAIVLANIFLPDTGSRYKRGYYHNNDAYYYCLDDDWYFWNSTADTWSYQDTVPEPIQENPEEYFDSKYYSSGFDCSDFSKTDFYSDWEDSRYDSADDGGWSASDWDSGATDWGSDW